ncbi:SteA domain-containing protein [Nocardia tengchongensis]
MVLAALVALVVAVLATHMGGEALTWVSHTWDRGWHFGERLLDRQK